MPNKSMFKRGYEAVREEKERQDKAREEAGTKLWNFFLKNDGDETTVRFLTEDPFTFDAHIIKDGKNFNTIVCPRSNGNTDAECALCDDDEKTTFMGIYLLIDKTEVEITNRKTNKKEKRKAQIKIYLPKSRVLSHLEHRSIKYGLTKRDYSVSRSGEGQQTTYIFDPEEPSKISREEISNLLPEKLREKYDGTMESLYNIVLDQLAMMTGDDYVADKDEDEEEPPKESTRSNLIDVDDEEPPKSETGNKLPFKKNTPPKMKGMFKKTY